MRQDIQLQPRTTGELTRNILCWTLCALLVAFTGFLLFVNLGVRGVLDYDEARHGVNAYEMVKSGNYIVSTFDGEPDYWNLKPPLSYWAIALGYKLFGYNALGLRFYSALSMLACVAALCVWMKRRVGTVAAVVSVLLILCDITVFGDHFARFGDADAQYQLLFTLAMLCMLQSKRKFGWLYGSALCFALAFLSKSYHAVLIPLICLMDFAWERRWKELSLRRVLTLAACALVPIALWAAARYSQDGLAFFKAMFSTDVVARVETADLRSDEPQGFAMYFGKYLTMPMLALGAAISLFGLVYCRANRAKADGDGSSIIKGCFLWAVVPSLVYSLLDLDYLWYAFSALVAVPALTGVMAQRVANCGRQRPLLIGCSVAALALCVTCVIPIVADVTDEELDRPYQAALLETLDREDFPGEHLYIQYNEEIKGEKITDWMPADRLAALWYGDAVCLPGGVDAFLADEGSATIIIGRSQNIAAVDALWESCVGMYDDGSIFIFGN